MDDAMRSAQREFLRAVVRFDELLPEQSVECLQRLSADESAELAALADYLEQWGPIVCRALWREKARRG